MFLYGIYVEALMMGSRSGVGGGGGGRFGGTVEN